MGFAATGGDRLIRGELCEEAIWLARLLHTLLPADAETAGLLALLLLHQSRVAARTDSAGKPVPLAEQDRSRWDAALIADPNFGAGVAQTYLGAGMFADWDLTGAAEDLKVVLEVGYRVAQGDRFPEWKPDSEFRARREAMLKASRP